MTDLVPGLWCIFRDVMPVVSGVTRLILNRSVLLYFFFQVVVIIVADVSKLVNKRFTKSPLLYIILTGNLAGNVDDA